MTREQHKINRLLRQVQSRLSKIETMMAEPVKDEPMKVEKIAVMTNDLRQFDLVYSNLSKKRSSSAFGYKFPVYVYLSDNITFDNDINSVKERGYTIIDFDFWAAQNNVEVPKPILTSMDGVPLYVGDKYFAAYNSSNSEKWIKCEFQKDDVYVIFKDTVCLDSERFFSTRESCEKWIEEQNKPEVIVLDYNTLKVVITKMGFSAEATDSRRFVFSREDLENIYAAHKSLK